MTEYSSFVKVQRRSRITFTELNEMHVFLHTKGHNGIYELTQKNLAVATTRSENLKKRFSRLPVVGPYTDVDEIVGILRNIRSSNR